MRGIAESQSPADTIELLNTYFTLMFEAIEGQGGIVNQIVGDGLMAIFGAPQPRPDHELRAVRAAMEMVQLIGMFNQQQAAEAKAPIKIGIGIASGRVIAGFTGTVHRATYTCVGETVNLAARLEAHCKIAAHPILIDQRTRDGLPSDVATEALGSVAIKGMEKPVPVYAVLAAPTP